MVLRAGFHGTVGQPSAQVIDGSLKFDKTAETYLTRTPGSAGNRKLWTLSYWIKFYGDIGAHLFSANNDAFQFEYRSGGQLLFANSGSTSSNTLSTARFRDYGQFYHVVIQHDAANTIARFYINGEENFTATLSNADGTWNNATSHNINGRSTSIDSFGSFGMSQCYFVDGQALEPTEFGFTDPLTNTWRPKKYTGTYGTNGFYLPMDGNSPIGEDKSGNGNNWTPVNFGGSVALDNPQVSGARPILNTLPGGAKAGVGVFGSKQNVGYAVTVYDDGGGNKYYIDGVKQATLTGLIRGATYTFDTSDSTVGSTHPFRFSDSDGGSEYTNGVAAITGTATTITIPHDAPNELYYYCTSHSGMGSSITGITTNEKLADLYASNIVFASPLVGANNDVCASIACTMTNKSVTSNGDAAAANEQSNFYAGSFEFDGTGDYLSSSSSSDLSFGTGDFTVECWVYQTSASSAEDGIFQISTNSGGLNASSSNTITLQTNSGTYRIYANDTSTAMSTSVITDKWVHLAVVRDSGTTKLFVNGIQDATTISDSRNYSGTYLAIGGYYSTSYLWVGYIQDFRVYKGVAKYTSNFVVPSTDPDILPDTLSGVSGGSKLTKITDGAVGFGTNGYMTTTSSDYNPGTGDFAIEGYFRFPDNSGTRRAFINDTGTFGSNSMVIRQYNTGFEFYCGGQSFSDSGYNMAQWNHAMITRSGTTIRYFVNGELRATDTSSNSISAQPTNQMTIGGFYDVSTPAEFMRGHASNLRLTVGSIPTDYQTSLTSVGAKVFTPSSEPLTSTSQGATSSDVKLLCCQSPTSATTATVASASLSTNNTVGAITFNPFNTDINTVRGQETGYCTWNPLVGTGTLSDGNLKFDGASNWKNTDGTISFSSGKWYYEGTYIGSQYGSAQGNIAAGIGFKKTTAFLPEGSNAEPVNSADYRNNTIAFYQNGYFTDFGTGTGTHTSIRSQIAAGDVVGVSIDLDNGSYEFYLNGISITSGTVSYTGELVPWIEAYYVNAFVCNFGQKPFKFSPPDGFQSLNAANIRPSTVIVRPDQYVGITTWTGDGTNNRVIQAPIDADFAWIKFRNQAYSHSLYDIVRGNNTRLVTNSTDGEGTVSFSFLNDKNIQISGASDTSQNDNNEPLVGWFWRAGGSKNTFNVDDLGYASAAAAGLTGGTITPTGASVGTKQGFSIIGYTGTDNTSDTFSHGLSQKPDFAIFKNRSQDGDDWIVYHSSEGATKRGKLNLTNVFDAQTSQFNDTEPTSSLFTIGTYDNINKLNNNYISYIWHNVSGLQKFGNYVSNGSTDGNFVELGFKPALLMIKSADYSATTTSWAMYTSVLYPNQYENALFANKSAAEGTRGDGSSTGSMSQQSVDLLSNGFKLRGSGSEINEGSSNEYIYAAWAEAPTFNLYGGQSNAR